jgi:hypothetical protein
MPVKTELCVRLHVADGLVWAAEGRELPFSTGRRVEQLESWLPDGATIRIVGSPENLFLIGLAWGWRSAGKVLRVELVSPAVCPRARDRRDPSRLLYQTRDLRLAPSQGGVHELTAAAAQLYMFALHPGSTPVLDRFAGTRLGHALRFVSDVDLTACLEIVARIVDPRWFIDTSCPDRTSKLEAYLGMHPKTQAGVLGFRLPWRRHAECSLVQRAWGRYFTPTDLPEAFGVGEFVQRRFWEQWARFEQPEQALVRGYLRASQRFLRFFRLVWLASIYAGSAAVPDGQAELFRPEDFFDTPGEAEAFHAHMEVISR